VTPEELKAARQELGLTVDKLASRLGISTRSMKYRLSGELPVRGAEAKLLNMELAAHREAKSRTRKPK